MKIFGICLVKNEGDIIRYALSQALDSFDRIYVLDNGSEDDTWEIVNEFAESDSRVVPYRQTRDNFNDSLRSSVFNAFRNEAVSGDWWCRLDGDEIYLDAVRPFLESVPKRHHVVWSQHLQFYLTEEDIGRFGGDDGGVPKIDAYNLPRYYRCNFSEARFFRHRNNLIWDGTSWPQRMGSVASKRIKVCHYQYRSPQQFELRLKTRKQAAAGGWEHFKKDEDKQSWRAGLADLKTLHRFDPSGTVVVEREVDGPVEPLIRRLAKEAYYWMRG